MSQWMVYIIIGVAALAVSSCQRGEDAAGDVSPHDTGQPSPDKINAITADYAFEGLVPIEAEGGMPVAEGCTPLLVDARSGGECEARVRRLLPNRLAGEISWILFPGTDWTQAQAEAELDRAKVFYAANCIDLEFQRRSLPEDVAADLEADYSKWRRAVVASIGGEDKLGSTTIGTGLLNAFQRGIVQRIQREAVRDARDDGEALHLLVVFGDLYIQAGRSTFTSATQEYLPQIGLMAVEQGSRHILSHELVHALGKESPTQGGKITWHHDNHCDKALLKIPRTDPMDLVNLSGRYLDVVDLAEIGNNRGGGEVLRVTDPM